MRVHRCMGRMGTWVSLAVALVLTLAGVCPAADIRGSEGVLVLPPVKQVPTVDGKIDIGVEYYDAAQIEGLQTYDQGVSEPRRARVFVGFTRTHLYFAVSTEVPPKGSLLAEMTDRDSPVVQDDAIEIFLDPHRAGGGRDRKVYQFLGNSKGTIYDRTLSADGKSGNDKWNGGWRFANTIEKGRWHAEVSIALSEIGATYEDLEKGIGFFVGRDWKQPSAFTGITRYGYMLVRTYPVLKAAADAPVVRVKRIGDLNRNRLDLEVSIHNPHARDQKARIEVKIASSNLPARGETKVIDLPRRGGGRYFYKFENSIDTENEATLTLSSPDGKTVYYRRWLKWRHVGERRWTTFESQKGPIRLAIAYYPYLNKLKVRAHLAALPPGAAVEAVGVIVASPEKKVIASTAVKEFKDAVGEVILDLPDLPDGTYQVTAKGLGPKAPKDAVTMSFLRKHFVWERNTLGISDEVIPPFTPLAVKGNEVSCILRRHQVNGFGLWDQVTSMDRDLLAAPMTVEVTADGKALPWERAAAKITERKPSRVVVESEAECERVKLSTVSTFDIDGCMKVELTYAGKGAGEIDTMSIDIPVRDETAPLYHVNADRIRYNPSGATPAGQGLVFDGMDVRRRLSLGSSLNYIWVGGMERGLCWFADNDKGWVIDDAKPSLTLTRKGPVLHLGVHLVRARTAVETPRRIVFGLMAGPAKPMQKDWRKLMWAVPYKDYPRGQWLFYSGETAPAPYPYKYQFEFWDQWQRTRETGVVPKDYIARWLKQFDGWEEREKFYKTHVAAFFHVAKSKPALFTPILDSYEIGVVHPEFHVFQDEWDLHEYRNRNNITEVRTRSDRHNVVTIDPVRSYTDFTVYYANEQMKRGMGQYLDNNFPQTNFDSLVSDAYVRPDGKLQGSGRIWHMRERIRRLAVLQHQHGVRGLMCHMTNGSLLPVLSFAQAALDWEWRYGNAPVPERFPADLIRAESTGLQTGCTPYVLTGIMDCRSKAEEKERTRQLWGVVTVHEIKTTDGGRDRPWFTAMEHKRFDFGYALADCEVFRYWDPRPPVTIKGGEVYWIAYARGGKAMLILCSYEKKPVRAEMTLAYKRLGLPRDVTAADAEGNTPAPSTDASGKLVVPLGEYGVRMLVLGPPAK